MKPGECESWEGASEEELQDGIEDGEPEAIAEYGSRLFQELERAKALLHRWARKAPDSMANMVYETNGFLGELPHQIEERRRKRAAIRGTTP